MGRSHRETDGKKGGVGREVTQRNRLMKGWGGEGIRWMKDRVGSGAKRGEQGQRGLGT